MAASTYKKRYEEIKSVHSALINTVNTISRAEANFFFPRRHEEVTAGRWPLVGREQFLFKVWEGSRRDCSWR
jgi:hypothetical protein